MHPCILATCVVPWDERGVFLVEPFVRQMRSLAGALTRHLYLFGTAGEGYAVTDRQFDEIAGVFVDECRALDVEPMLGLISLSTTEVIERVEHWSELGVRDYQISLPAWHALDDAELASFFRETCGRFPHCRFLHYNLLRTKRLLAPDDYVRLTAEHPNLVATKNTGFKGDELNALVAATPTLTHFVSERGLATVAGTEAAARCGLLTSISSISAARCREYFAAVTRGDADKVNALFAEIEILTEALIRHVGKPRIDGAYDKVLWALHDPSFPLRLLPPYVGGGDEALGALRQEIAERLPSWTPEPV